MVSECDGECKHRNQIRKRRKYTEMGQNNVNRDRRKMSVRSGGDLVDVEMRRGIHINKCGKSKNDQKIRKSKRYNLYQKNVGERNC